MQLPKEGDQRSTSLRFFPDAPSYQLAEPVLSINDEPPQPRLRTISKKKIALVIVGGVVYFFNGVNLESFLLKEVVEYVANDSIKTIWLWIGGCILSAPPTAAWTLCIINNVLHLERDDHILNESDWDDTETYGNKWYDWLRDFLLIGLVTGIMGFDSLIENVDYLARAFDRIQPELKELLGFAILAGLIDGTGDLIVLRSSVVEAVNSTPGDNWITRFGRSLIDTFFINVWCKPETLKGKLWQAFIKYGTVVDTWLTLYFVLDIASTIDGLKSLTGGYEWIIDAFAATLLTVFTSNMAARNIDHHETHRTNFTKLTMLLLGSISLIRTIPSSLQFARFFRFDSGPGEGKLYNALMLTASSVVFGPPSFFSNYATISRAFKGVMMYLGKRYSFLQRELPVQQRDWDPNDMIKLSSYTDEHERILAMGGLEPPTPAL